MIRALLLVVCVARTAAAQPAGEADEPSAADVAGKPVPGGESGRTDLPRDESTLRALGRGALFLPKVALEVAFTPVRGGIWLDDRFRLHHRIVGLFFNDAGTIGLYPVAEVQSDYGLAVGAAFVDHDLFGEGERLKLRGMSGGPFRQEVSGRLRSGDRFGERVGVEIGGEFERRGREPFYGIGNDDIDRLSGEPITKTRFREQRTRGRMIADVRAVSDLHLRASGSLAETTFAPSEAGPPIDEVFPAETMMTGWDGMRQAYSELELRWDSRRRQKFWEPVRSTGWLLAGYAGRSTALDLDGSDYWRYGVDLQRFVRLGAGPRVLSARLYGETVSGSLEEVPFTDLPVLGGKTLLRGYPLDRFRDRAAAMGSLEYSWDLSRVISASTFVDAGRVYPSVQDASLRDLRVGYGFGLEGHTSKSFLIRASVASSIDGGIFFDVAFDPVFDLDPRVER